MCVCVCPCEEVEPVEEVRGAGSGGLMMAAVPPQRAAPRRGFNDRLGLFEEGRGIPVVKLANRRSLSSRPCVWSSLHTHALNKGHS